MSASESGASGQNEGIAAEDAGGAGAAQGGGTAGREAAEAGQDADTSTRAGSAGLAGEGGASSEPSLNACELPEDTPCFEPCGGDPIGSWVLEDTCFAAGTLGESPGCQRAFEGTVGKSSLRLQFYEDARLRYYGTEAVSLRALVSLPCISSRSADACRTAYFRASPLLFNAGGELNCEPSACGGCSCSGEMAGSNSEGLRWHTEGSVLWLGPSSLSYCVQGDELWVGRGKGAVAYKFTRRSCTGTPVPCEERSEAECETGDQGCSLGRCDTKGTSSECFPRSASEEECIQYDACTWNPHVCRGKASCEFDTCDSEPGCRWGAPEPRCRGGAEEQCIFRSPSACEGDGCSLHHCTSPAGGPDLVDCAVLTSAEDCAKAPNCAMTSEGCAGGTWCSDQTDLAICDKLRCRFEDHCTGTIECSNMSAEQCASFPGCTIEW